MCGVCMCVCVICAHVQLCYMFVFLSLKSSLLLNICTMKIPYISMLKQIHPLHYYQTLNVLPSNPKSITLCIVTLSATFSLTSSVAPTFSVKFSDNVMDCLDFPLIEQDSPPLDLVVNLMADPCTDVKWYINNTLITNATGNTEVCELCSSFL